MLAALGAAIVLAGCSHPASTDATNGLVSDQLTGGACPTWLDLGFADDGSTKCVRLGGDVAIDTVGPYGMFLPTVEQAGSVLTPDAAASVPHGVVAYRATSRGTAVITSVPPPCAPSGAAAACLSATQWSVTVIVK